MTLGNEVLIRAAFEVLREGPPLTEQEQAANRDRDEKHRIGNCIFATPTDLRETQLVAIGAWQRELRRRLPNESPDILDATLAATYAMKLFGTDLGYDLGSRGKSGESGLRALRAAHPGFPKDLYREVLRWGAISSIW